MERKMLDKCLKEHSLLQQVGFFFFKVFLLGKVKIAIYNLLF